MSVSIQRINTGVRRLEVETHSGMQEAQPQGSEDGGSSQIGQLDSGLQRPADTFDAWNEEFSAKARLKIRSGLRARFHSTGRQHVVKIQTGLEKEVLEKLETEDVVAPGSGRETDHSLSRDVLGEPILEGHGGGPAGELAGICELAVEAEAQPSLEVPSMGGRNGGGTQNRSPQQNPKEAFEIFHVLQSVAGGFPFDNPGGVQ